MSKIIQEQISLDTDIELIAITDLDGIITYTNEALLEISGYAESGLVGGRAHKLNHKDMPKAATLNFKSKIKFKKSWCAAVKKVSVDGRYYWVKEVITPIYENSSVVAYQSVSTSLSLLEVKNAVAIYHEINEFGFVFFNWENFYFRLALYTVVSGALFILGMLFSLPHLLYAFIPFVIYFCEIKKSVTFFETKSGNFDDVTRCIFNKNYVHNQEECETEKKHSKLDEVLYSN